MLTAARSVGLTYGWVKRVLGLEAAQGIKWHQAGGPDTVENGLALCVMHHKLLDLGVYTLSNERTILVSDQIYGYLGVDDWVIRYHGNSINLPKNPDAQPQLPYSKLAVGVRCLRANPVTSSE